jgi:phosphate acetyltransferase
MQKRPHVQSLIERARGALPLRAAFVYPCDREALQVASSGALAGYVAPVLIGPGARIRDEAAAAGLHLTEHEIVDTGSDPAHAVAHAIALARARRVSALVKGSLSDEALLAAIAAPETGLRTGTRLSHACVLDLPGFDRPLVVADARLNVAPTLAAKRDILVNALQLARAIGVGAPAVALLAAVDGPSQAFASTTDAVALRSMGMQGLFGPATFIGPVTPDAALVRERRGSAGADVLLAPGMEAAVMLVRSLVAVTGGVASGLALGTRVPVALPARGDSLESNLGACVLAALAARAVLPVPSLAA